MLERENENVLRLNLKDLISASKKKKKNTH